jgi:hypothetical protein
MVFEPRGSSVPAGKASEGVLAGDRSPVLIVTIEDLSSAVGVASANCMTTPLAPAIAPNTTNGRARANPDLRRKLGE